MYLLARGRAEEAINETKRAVELDPTFLFLRGQLARAYYLGHRYKEMIPICHELAQMESNSLGAHVWLGQAYTFLGKPSQGILELETANKLRPGDVEIMGALGYAYAVGGTAIHFIAPKNGRIAPLGPKMSQRTSAFSVLSVLHH